MQNVRGRSDRIRPQIQRQTRPLPRSHQPQRQRQIPRNIAVRTRRERRHRRSHLIGDREILRRLPEIPPRTERRDIRLRDHRPLRELPPQKRLRPLRRTVIHPRQQTQRKHILAALGLLPGQTELLQRLQRQRRQRHRMDPVPLQGPVLQRRHIPADLRHRPLRELVRVHDDLPAPGHIREIRPQRRRVHRHQHIRRVPRRENVMIREMQLERRHPRQRPGRRPDLRRKIRQRRQIIPERRRLRGEPVTRELHTITRITSEPDHHPIQPANLPHTGPGRHRLGHVDVQRVYRVHRHALRPLWVPVQRRGSAAR